MVVCVFVAESYIWSGFKMFRRHFLVSAKETYGALRKGLSFYQHIKRADFSLQKGEYFAVKRADFSLLKRAGIYFTKGRKVNSEKGGISITHYTQMSRLFLISCGRIWHPCRCDIHIHYELNFFPEFFPGILKPTIKKARSS